MSRWRTRASSRSCIQTLSTLSDNMVCAARSTSFMSTQPRARFRLANCATSTRESRAMRCW